MMLTVSNNGINESTYTGTEYLTKDFNGGILTYNINKFTDILIVLGFKYIGNDTYITYDENEDMFIVYHKALRQFIVCWSDTYELDPNELYFILSGESDITWEDYKDEYQIKEKIVKSLEELFN